MSIVSFCTLAPRLPLRCRPPRAAVARMCATKADIAAAVAAIHESQTRAVVYCTGGGSSSIGDLLVVPGASRTVLHAATPYSRAALHDLIASHNVGALPESLASEQCARILARAALSRAVALAPPTHAEHLVGVGAACALATQPARRGADRAHVVVCDATTTRVYRLAFGTASQLDQAADVRHRQERATARLMLHALAAAADVQGECTQKPRAFASLNDDDVLDESSEPLHDALCQVLAGRVTHAYRPTANVPLIGDVCGSRVLLAGSFNPLHVGHSKLLEAAVQHMRKLLGCDVNGAFELSVCNADKPTAPEDVIRRRLAQFGVDQPVVISNAPLFTDKAKLFADTTFVVGFDTAVRLVNAKYYGGNDDMLQALVGVALRGCSFLVAARVDDDGTLRTLSDVDVPPALRDLFRELPPSEFREDVSSTTLRKAGVEV